MCSDNFAASVLMSALTSITGTVVYAFFGGPVLKLESS